MTIARMLISIIVCFCLTSICGSAETVSAKSHPHSGRVVQPPHGSAGRCQGLDNTTWLVGDDTGDYNKVMNSSMTLSPKANVPNEYEMTFDDGSGTNPAPELKSLSLVRADRSKGEISYSDLEALYSSWNTQAYLQHAVDIVRSGYDYMAGIGLAAGTPTLAVFMHSKYDNKPGDCRGFVLVLKKLNEDSGLNERTSGKVPTSLSLRWALQGGVLHGHEN